MVRELLGRLAQKNGWLRRRNLWLSLNITGAVIASIAASEIGGWTVVMLWGLIIMNVSFVVLRTTKW